MERQVGWAKENGFTKIWVTGHSEGGRVVQGLKAEVAGVMTFGMDCKNMAFWSPNPRNRIQVFLSSRELWLGQGGAEFAQELEMIANGQAPNSEQAKLSQAASADIVWSAHVSNSPTTATLGSCAPVTGNS